MSNAPPKLRRRWFQFSLRTLLIGTTIIALGCGWLALKLHEASKRQQAVAAIKAQGGEVIYDWDFDWKPHPGQSTPAPPQPAWLRKITTDDFFADVHYVDMAAVQEAKDLEPLQYLTQLRVLRIDSYDVNVADGMKYLAGMTNLEELRFSGVAVTDVGVSQLKGLSKLKTLALYRASVTGNCLYDLQGMTDLEILNLTGAYIQDEDLRQLEHFKRLKELTLYRTKVTGAGLKHLAGLRELVLLNLDLNDISEDGLKHLQGLSKLKYLYLSNSQVTAAGLKYLEPWKQLIRLDLSDTKVGYGDTEELRRALPNCQIKTE